MYKELAHLCANLVVYKLDDCEMSFIVFLVVLLEGYIILALNHFCNFTVFSNYSTSSPIQDKGSLNSSAQLPTSCSYRKKATTSKILRNISELSSGIGRNSIQVLHNWRWP